jgi:hypothetical protein
MNYQFLYKDTGQNRYRTVRATMITSTDPIMFPKEEYEGDGRENLKRTTVLVHYIGEYSYATRKGYH